MRGYGFRTPPGGRSTDPRAGPWCLLVAGLPGGLHTGQVDYEGLLLRTLTEEPGPVADEVLQWLVTGRRAVTGVGGVDVAWPAEPVQW